MSASSAPAVAPAAVRSLPAAFTSRHAQGQAQFIIGLMSGTSLDGVDAVLARFPRSDDAPGEGSQGFIVAHHFVPMPSELRSRLLQLNSPSACVSDGGELHQMALASNALSHLYAEAVGALLEKSQMRPEQIEAIGNHGQTIRHLPGLAAAPAPPGSNGLGITRAYTMQIGNHALLAELTGIPVIGDFRSRDVAAGGQGAPLVPAFHKAFFGAPAAATTAKAAAGAVASSTTAAAVVTAAASSATASGGLLILNLGGIANLSHLRADGSVSGFDTGPANVLSDLWIQCKRFPREQEPGVAGAVAAEEDAPIHEFDPLGLWASRGVVQPALLRTLLDSEPYFAAPPPKSTGRDLFNPSWLEARGVRLVRSANQQSGLKDEDVAATLVELTAVTIAQAVERFCSDGGNQQQNSAAAAPSSSAAAPSSSPGSSSSSLDPILVCGGGAHNSYLLSRLQSLLPSRSVQTTSSRGVPAECVESLAFAWMAHQFLRGRPANLPAVTGARGLRVLGCYYPA